jgi:hypothetical protein
MVEMGELIGLVAVVMIFGTPWVVQFAKSRERIAMLKMQTQQTPDQDVMRQLDALRQEISQLRDTCTQFDVSHDNALERLDQRMRLLESKNAATLSTSGESPRLQTIERR